MVKTRSRSAPKPIQIAGKDRRVITKSEEFDEIVRRARRDAKKGSIATSDDGDTGDNVPPISDYDESIGRIATDDDEKTLRHEVRNLRECFKNTMIMNNDKDDDQYIMIKNVDNGRLVEGMRYQYNCFIEDDMKRYSMPQWEKKPIDLCHADNLKIGEKLCGNKVDKYGVNLCDKSDNESFVVSDKGPGSLNQQRGLMKVKQSKFGRDYPNISKSERVRKNTHMSKYESSENRSYRQFEEIKQYPIYPQYGSYQHMPMMPVYNLNVKIDAYDPKESFTLFYERFESMLLLNGVPSHLKLPMLKLHLKGRVANDVQTQREIKNDYKRLVDYLKRNYIGEESIAAVRHKLSSLKIDRSIDLINVGNEISRLIDVIYVEESHEDRLRRKKQRLAELLPVGIIRSLIKHDRPLYEPFDHTLLVAKDYWDDLNAGSKMIKGDKVGDGRIGKFQGTCNFCSKKGHKEIDCRDKKKKEKLSLKEINFMNKDDKHSDVKETNATDMMKGEVDLVKPNNNKLPIIQVKINDGESIKMLVDTGSEITILPMKFKNDNCYVNVNDVMYVKTLNDNGAIKSYKTKKEVEFKVGNQIIKCHAYLCDIDFSKRSYDGILGWNIFKQLTVTFDEKNDKIVFHDADEKSVEINVSIIDEVEKTHWEVQKLKEEFHDIIAKNEFDLGSGKIKCQSIVLKNGCEFLKPAMIPVQEVDKPKLKEYLDNLEASGVIVRKPSPYAMPIIILNKSDGRKRIIGDMRSINSIVQPIYYSPPLINHAILKMRNCNYYTKLDCNNAYFQIGVPAESQKYLAVKTPFGVYQFKRMVQGYINSSSEFQRLGEEILHGLEEFCTNYIDDIVIHTVGSMEFHISKVKEVLLRIRDADLRISFDKCSFFGRSIKYLGFHINENGSTPHEGNIKSFLRRPFPESKKALKSLVASANYYRNYIENFAEITYHLDNLLKKKYRKLIWNENAKESYKKLINAMSNPKFCHHPVLEDDFILTTDSSNHSIGGVLSQLRDGKEVPISFYSKRLSPTKRKRCATYKELMAISRCFRHFKYYFGGSRIHIRTDHLPLIGIFKNSVDNRYLELTNDLAGFDYRIHYVKGSSNVVADDLSRETYNPNDLEFSGDEDESDVEVNVIKCVKVADFLDCVNIDAYNIDENSDCDNVSDDELLNTIESNVLKNKGDVMIKRKRGRPRKTIAVEFDDVHPLMELVENKDGILNIDFKKHQKNDKEIQEAIETGMYDGKEIRIMDDIVYVKTKQSRKGQELRRIIPTSLYDKVLCLAHKMRGHFGLAKTKHLIEEVGYVKSINSIVNKYISECDECMRRNSPTKLHPKMSHVNQYTMPFQNLAADICGPIIPTSTCGNKYLLVFVDSFSRYTIIIPCRSYSFNEIFQKIMDEVIWKHGNPLSIRTDNGSNFKGEKLIEVFETLGVKQEFSTAYHSRGNSICERALKWIQNTMAKLSKSKRERWDVYAQAVAYYYNTTVCVSHGFTPFYLHYLRNPNTGLQTLLNIQKNYKVDRNPELVELVDVAKEAYKEAKLNLENTLKSRPEGKIRNNDLGINEYVYVKLPDTSCGSKLALEWSGPFKILKVDGHKITVETDKRKKKVVHFSNCKRCKRRDVNQEQS